MAVIIAPAVGWASFTHEGESELSSNISTVRADQNPLVAYAQGTSVSNSQTVGYPT